MEARRIRSAAMARGRTIGAWSVVAAAMACGLGWAHRHVSHAEATLASAEARSATSTTSIPRTAPPITASFSTIAACRPEEIELERCSFFWRPGTSLTFPLPELHIAGEAAAVESVERFVDRLGEHSFLGDATIASVRSRHDGTVAFEIALGDGPMPIARSIVVQGARR